MPEAVTEDDVVVHTSGPVTPQDVAYGRRKVAALFPLAPGSVLFAKIDLTVHGDPARDQPAFAKAELDLDGRFLRAHATGTTVLEAVDALEARLRERLERDVHRAEAVHLRHRNGDHEDHEWRHGDEPTRRPSYFPRPVEDREVVRRKTFAMTALTPEEASIELEQLDHDFYLFTSALTGADSVVFRSDDGGYELIERDPSPDPDRPLGFAIRASALRPAVMTADEAIDLLDLGDEPFVFFVDASTARGNVVYRRYDGHYGLIVPIDAP